VPSASPRSDPKDRLTADWMIAITIPTRIASMSSAPNRWKNVARGPDGSAMALLRLEESMSLPRPPGLRHGDPLHDRRMVLEHHVFEGRRVRLAQRRRHEAAEERDRAPRIVGWLHRPPAGPRLHVPWHPVL